MLCRTLHFDLAFLQDTLNGPVHSVCPVQNLTVDLKYIVSFSFSVCSSSSFTPFSEYQFQYDRNPFLAMVVPSGHMDLSQSRMQKHMRKVIFTTFQPTLRNMVNHKKVIDQRADGFGSMKILRDLEVVSQPLSKLIAGSHVLETQLQVLTSQEESKDKIEMSMTYQFVKEDCCRDLGCLPIMMKGGPYSKKPDFLENLKTLVAQKFRESHTPKCLLDRFRTSEKIFALVYSCSESTEILNRCRKRLHPLPQKSLSRWVEQMLDNVERMPSFIQPVGFRWKQVEAYNCLFKSLNTFRSKVSFHYAFTVIKEGKLKTLVPQAFPTSTVLHQKIGRQYLLKFDPPQRKIDSILHQTITSNSFLSSSDNLPFLSCAENNTVDETETRLTQNRFEFLNIFPDNEEENVDFELFIKSSQTSSLRTRSGHLPGENTVQDIALIGLQEQELNEKALTVAVPESMNCCSWSTRVAEQCLVSSRVFLVSPPLLNMLPSLVIIAQSFLSRPQRDDRVAIMCDGEPSDVTYVHSFFKSCFEDSVSINIVRSEPGTQSMYNGADACKVTARVVIIDSFTTQIGDGFSLLLIIVSDPTLMRTRGARCTLQPLWIRDAARWRSIPSIVIAPGNIWTGLQAFSERIPEFAHKLDVTRVIHLADSDDIALAMELARPAIACIEPAAHEKSFCFLLEKIGRKYLPKYNEVVRREKWQETLFNSNYISDTKSIQDVSTEFLRAYISQLTYWDEECEELARIYDIKQLQTYAIHDGIDIAMQFLKECKRNHPSRHDIWDQIMVSVEKFDTPERLTSHATDHSDDMCLSFSAGMPRAQQNEENKEAPRGYRMANILDRIACKAKERMLTEAPSLREIHRREHFRPLVVTDSSEARDQLRRIECWKGQNDHKIVVYKWDELCNAQNNIKRVNLEEFSHVFHITDDRYDAIPSSRLPSLLLQCVFSGRTRLTTIFVDISRTICNLWKENEKTYIQLERKVSRPRVEERRIPFIVETDTKTIQSILRIEAQRNIKPLTTMDKAR